MVHKDNNDPDGVFSFRHTADALDQLKLEDEIEALDQKIGELEQSRSLIPGRKKKLLQELQGQRGQLGMKLLSVKEEVAANSEQADILERQRSIRKQAQESAAHEVMKPKHDIAKQISRAAIEGVSESNDELIAAKPSKPDPMAQYASMSDVEKQKLQSDMLVTEAATVPEPDDFGQKEWLLKRELKLKLKRKGPGGL